ncbi:MAG: response regulator transcription factor [Oligoflexia bacterium]|nr:response regulator transcription factor [Oligoflexia bacterium]
MKRILIIEDDPAFLQLVSQLLSSYYEPLTAASGAEGLRQARECRPDLVLVDVRMPEINGFEVCRRLRDMPETRDVPIIMLTGQTEMENRVRGLELGADDYVLKPFDASELLARIKARLRRAKSYRRPFESFQVANLMVDPRRGEVTLDGERVELTRAELQLLQYFLERPDELVSREQLLGDLWAYTAVSRTVDTHVARLRQKLKGFDWEIRTVFGAGYILKTGEDD